MEPGVRVEAGVQVRARCLRLRQGAHLESGVGIGGMRGGAADRVDIGEHSFLGHDLKVALPELTVGDFTSVHNHVLLNGDSPMAIGHNCWIGQNCLLNSEAPLQLGNNVCVSAYNSIYTHGYWGDQLQGCELSNVAPTRLDDDAWMMGSYSLVGPGVTVGRRAVILAGSVVTRSVAPEDVVGGTPAGRVEWERPLYVLRGAAEQRELMREFVRQFLQARRPDFSESQGAFWCEEGVFWFEHPPEPAPSGSCQSLGFITQLTPALEKLPGTLFVLPEGRYRRARLPLEVELIRWLRSHRARFVPLDRLRVELP